MALKIGIVGLPNAGHRRTLSCSRGLHPRVARACLRGSANMNSAINIFNKYL